jgi:ABC-type branched-subunit amino acid transport system ATPase component
MKSGVLIGPKGSGKSHLVNVFCKNFEKERW